MELGQSRLPQSSWPTPTDARDSVSWRWLLLSSSKQYLRSETNSSLISEAHQILQKDALSEAAGHEAQVAYCERQRVFKEGDDEAIREETLFGFHLHEDEYDVLNEEIQGNLSATNWGRFDAFFGIWVLMNGIAVGLAFDGHVEEGSMVDTAIKAFFMVLFTVEFCLRWYFLGSFRQLMRDFWCRFDVAILSVSYLGFLWRVVSFIGASGSTAGGAAAVSVLRVARLLRLARMLRLVRLVEKFRLLLRGLAQGGPVLGWSMFMSVLLGYLGAIIIFEATKGDFESHPEVKAKWDSIPSCMLSMFQIATLDGGELARELLTTRQTGWWVLVYFIFWFSIMTIGIGSVMTGILLNIVLVFIRRDQQVEDVSARCKLHRDMRTLRWALIDHFGLRSGSERKCLSKDIVFDLMMNDTKFQGKLDPDHPFGDRLAGHSFHTLFLNAGIGYEEADAIFETVENALDCIAHLSIDEFIQQCLCSKTDVHPLEVFNLRTHLQNIKANFDRMLSTLHIVLHALDDTLHQVQPLLAKFHRKPHKLQHQLIRRLAHQRDESRHAVKRALRTEEMNAMEAARKQKLEYRIWRRFDSAAGFMILLNGACVGLELRHGEQMEAVMLPQFWQMVEVVFNVIFLEEFWLRVVLLYQMRELQRFRTNCGIFPRIRAFGRIRHICSYIPKAFAQQRSMYVDLLFVLVGVVETIVLRHATDQGSNLFQAFRVLRLGRFARLPHMLYEVRLIAQGSWHCMPVVMASFVSLVFIVYMCAVVMCEVVGTSAVAAERPEDFQAWSDLGYAFLCLMEVATGSSFRSVVKIVPEFPTMAVVLGVMLISCSLGLMNVITGMMVVSGLRALQEISFQKMTLRLLEAKAHTSDAVWDVLLRHREAKKKEVEHLHSGISKLQNALSMELDVRSQVDFRSLMVDTPASRSTSFDRRYSKTGSRFIALETRPSSAASELGELAVFGVSQKNGEVRCKVLNVMWISRGEIVMDCELEGQLLEDDEQPILAWKGGAASPCAAMELSDSKRFVWSNVPPVGPFQFSYGPGFTHLEIKPGSCGAEEMRKHGLINATAIASHDTKINATSLRWLLEDQQLLSLMSKVGFKPHQVLAVFQRLILDSSGTVSVADFVDALQRMNMPSEGLDIAAMKMLLRQAVVKARSTLSDVSSSHVMATELVAKLRHLHFVDADVDDKVIGDESGIFTHALGVGLSDLAVSEMCDAVSRRNARLRKKIHHLREHVKVRAKTLRREGIPYDRARIGFGNSADSDSDKDSDSMMDGLSVPAEHDAGRLIEVESASDGISEYSLESAQANWD